MKLIFNGNSTPYQVETETGSITQAPEKCYRCKNRKKVSEGCSLENCDTKDLD